MATLKIYEDQENRGPAVRQKQNTMDAQHKRLVLSTIDQNNLIKNQPINKGKQAVKTSGFVNNKILQKKAENNKNVVVPVAQFEAFKVYEDDDDHENDRNVEKSNKIIKNIDSSKLLPKVEWLELQRNQNEDYEQKKEYADGKTLLQSGIPISIEKQNEENSGLLAERIILKKHATRNMFYDCEEYREDIYRYLLEHERRHRPKPGYIVKQPDVTENMRAILVDWLVEVAEEYHIQTETLYLAVNYIDRFLSYMSVVRAKLQLVGTAAMFIAAKYEEIISPEVAEFVYITDDTYDRNQVIRMEHLILKVLSFDLSVPTPLTFINAICIAAKLNEKVMYLSMYLSELTLLDVEPLLLFLPSTIAASAIYLSRQIVSGEGWTDELETKTSYSLDQLRPCIAFLKKMYSSAATLPQQAIQEKYKSSKYMNVANLPLAN